MITEDTVFILGAGASVPYGYPTGLQLRKQIIENLDINLKKTDIDLPNALLRQLLLQERTEESKELKDNLLESRRSSIDLFLENRPGFCNIGKLAIACGIIEFEQSNKGPWDWFEHLHDSELANNRRSLQSYCTESNVNFITFNYDRHLEHSLISSLTSTYGANEEECAELIKENFEIVHVHGKLDDLPWESDNGRSYGYKPSSLDELKESASGIEIIHENVEERYFGKARELIEDAKLIVFLGLNLHNQINLDRLNIKNNIEGKRIYATLKGLTGPQREAASEYFNHTIINKNIGKRKPEVYDYGSYDLIREEVRFR